MLIELGVPGADVIVAHDASVKPSLLARGRRRTLKQDEPDSHHRRATVAIREAFEAARRRLLEQARKKAGEVSASFPVPRSPFPIRRLQNGERNGNGERGTAKP